MENITSKNEFKMNNFDGPLDLLVSLIRDHKKSIMDINISEITQQYLDYINQNIQDILIDEASDFILMATYLIDLKAKTLIPHLNPQSNKNETEFEIEKFKRRIFLYQQYKNIVSELREKQFGRFKRLSKPQDNYEEYYLENIPDAPLPLSISVDKIVYSWRNVLIKKRQNKVEVPFLIKVNKIDVEKIQTDIIQFINKTSFTSLSIEDYFRTIHKDIFNFEYACGVFVSLLVLEKDGLISIQQENYDATIYITKNLSKDIRDENLFEVNEAIKKSDEILQDALANLKIIKDK